MPLELALFLLADNGVGVETDIALGLAPPDSVLGLLDGLPRVASDGLAVGLELGGVEALVTHGCHATDRGGDNANAFALETFPCPHKIFKRCGVENLIIAELDIIILTLGGPLRCPPRRHQLRPWRNW